MGIKYRINIEVIENIAEFVNNQIENFGEYMRIATENYFVDK